MSGFTVDQPAQIQAEGAPGVLMAGSNTKVKGQPGFLGTAFDALSFGNGATAPAWTVPNTRTRVGGVFMVSQSSQAIASVPTTAPPHPAPVLVASADPKIRSL